MEVKHADVASLRKAFANLTVETLVDEDEAYIVVVRSWFEETELYQALVKEVEWASYDVLVRGRRIPQPRMAYACGDKDVTVHRYAGARVPVHTWDVDAGSVKEVRKIRDRLDALGLHFNACLLNYYRDGKDYVSYHSDKEALGFNSAVATVSLGVKRDFVVKRKEGMKVVAKVCLAPGDLCLMLGKNAQIKFLHSVPKRLRVSEGRISLTYRLLVGEKA